MLEKRPEKETEVQNKADFDINLFIKIGIIQRLQKSENATDIKLTNKNSSCYNFVQTYEQKDRFVKILPCDIYKNYKLQFTECTGLFTVRSIK